MTTKIQLFIHGRKYAHVSRAIRASEIAQAEQASSTIKSSYLLATGCHAAAWDELNREDAAFERQLEAERCMHEPVDELVSCELAQAGAL